jgi:hypothetical protein
MADQSALPPSWEVPQEFRDRLGKQAGRQRAMLYEGHLLLILHRPPRPDDPKRSGRLFWRKPDGSWISSELGSGPQALSRHLDQYAEVLEKYDKQEEAAVDADDYFAVLEPLAPVHRATRHLHQTFQEARKMLPQDRDLINFRDRAYEIERMAELLYQETQNSLRFLTARRAEEQAASSQRMAVSAHRLNVLAAFFFPIATLSTIFGANLAHGWEQEAAPIPFLAMLIVGLAFGFLLKSFVTEDLRKPAPKSAADGSPPRDGLRTPNRVQKVPTGWGRPYSGRQSCED